MGTYATKADMVTRYGEQELIELTDRADPPTDVLDEAVLDRAIEDAEAEVNSYLEGRYTLPFPTVPKVLVRLTCDMARYHLYEQRATETVVTRYEAAVKFLQAVSSGKATLGVAAPEEPIPSSGGPEFVAAPRVFTRDSLRDFL